MSEKPMTEIKLEWIETTFEVLMDPEKGPAYSKFFTTFSNFGPSQDTLQSQVIQHSEFLSVECVLRTITATFDESVVKYH